MAKRKERMQRETCISMPFERNQNDKKIQKKRTEKAERKEAVEKEKKGTSKRG